MAKIFASCPVTGHPVDTGIEIDEESFHRLTNVVGRMHCPHCGTEHGWIKDQAWVSENGQSEQ